MKKLYNSIFILFLLMIIPFNGQSQCKHFAKQICKQELEPYIHDGNYNAAVLTEGESAEMYKTFYSGQNYRVAICAANNLPDIHFQILDVDRNVLYDNSKDDFDSTWDFYPENSQQLIISLKVKNSDQDTEEPVSGCVAIMIGLKEER
ncbi:MAG: hypothetical protein ACLFPH_05565 [Bacteroidales bacterium]